MTTPSRAFRPGQRVRVSFEATVVESASDFDDLVRTDNPLIAYGRYAHALHPSQVEVIDDPASDPIGTVRSRPGRGPAFVKSACDQFPWKSLADYWEMDGYQLLRGWTNADLRGAEIIGMVPGFERTP